MPNRDCEGAARSSAIHRSLRTTPPIPPPVNTQPNPLCRKISALSGGSVLPKIKSIFISSILTLQLIHPLSTKAAAPSLSDAPAFSLTPKDLQQFANQQSGATTSSTVILLDDEQWTFHADHTLERKQHTIQKILDQSGVEAWSSVQDRWEPWRQERPSYRARVITPDGVAHELDPKTLVEGPAGGEAPQTYSDLRIVHGPLPAVSVGAIVETELTERSTLILGSIAFRGYLAWNAPVRFARMTVDYPESLPFRYTAELCPQLKETKEIRDGVVHLTASFGSFEAVKELEPLLPFDAPRTATITLSTAASWNDIALQYAKIVDKQIANAPVADLVSQAVNGETNRLAIIQNLVSRLHAEVRYTGVEFADAAIVPAQPADTLHRKYGDCKDKASLLVAMLRAANIPAYVAILNAGLEQDVTPNHPGMGMFNHAIVYVPGTPDLWIDATAEYQNVGSLPPQDEGRLALIARQETKELTKIPESRPANNVLLNTTDYQLSDFGPSHIVQTSGGTGPFESTYRQLFTMMDNADVRRGAEKQTQSDWNTKSDVKFTYPTPTDMAKPFSATADIPNAKSVSVSETGVAITLPLVNVFSTLPQFFGTEDPKDPDPKDAKKPRTVGFVLPMAFISKVECRIHIPSGFALKKMPADQTMQFGPATYSAHFVLKNGVLTASAALDTAKRNYTLEEGNTARKAIVEFLKQPPVVLNLAPQGQTLLESGKLREGLDAFRKLAAGHKDQAINHVRLSRAYLQTGCGVEARKEAKLASDQNPDITVTWRNLAFVLEHDLLGRRYKPGWNPAAVEDALSKAVIIDPDDLTAKIELAETLTYDAQGEQYQSKERLAKAVNLLRSLGDDKLEEQGQQDLFVYQLALLGELTEMKAKLERFASNGSRAGYHVFLTAVQEGAPKAAAELKGLGSPDESKNAFLVAVNLLARTGRYQIEADLATNAGFESQLFTAAANLRNVRPANWQTWKPDSPENLVKAFLAAEFETNENGDSLARFWPTPSSPYLRAHLTQQQQARLNAIAQYNLDRSVSRDVYFSNTAIATDTNGPDGFRVRLTSSGRTFHMFVARDHEEFKLLGDGEYVAELARRVIADVDAGHPDVARKWLDWLREDIKIHSEDDPLGGPVFPRIWNKGTPATPAQIRYAAASLMSSPAALPILRDAINATPDPNTKAFYQLAFGDVSAYAKHWSECLPSAKALASAYPASDAALRLLSQSLAGTGDVDAAQALLKKAMTDSPENLEPKRALIRALALGHRMPQSEQAAKETAEAPELFCLRLE